MSFAVGLPFLGRGLVMPRCSRVKPNFFGSICSTPFLCHQSQCAGQELREPGDVGDEDQRHEDRGEEGQQHLDDLLDLHVAHAAAGEEDGAHGRRQGT